MPTSANIGFIGLGIMGQAMASNLVKAGHKLTVYNRTPEKAKALKALGARQVATPAEAAPGNHFIISMVNDGPDVNHLLFGPEGAAGAASPGTIFIDMTTMAPVGAAEIGERLKVKRMPFLDAPVSGGDTGARDGTLSIMVGGDAKTLEQSRGVLSALGKNITHMGPNGAGQMAKACNQILVAMNTLALAECVALARKSGLKPETLTQALSGGMASSKVLEMLGPKMFKGDFSPGFKAKHMYKDLKNTIATAKLYGLELKGAQEAMKALSENILRGEGELGTQVMYRVVNKV